MRYEVQINEAFTRLGFSPRGRQVEDIDKVMTAFLDEGFKTVVLSAPTGTGKSIIGAVVAEAIHQIRHPESTAGASFLLTPTIVLQEQYQKSFAKDDPFDTTFRLIKGAGNFTCEALSTPSEPQTAESCAIRLFQKEGLTAMIQQHCDGCGFAHQKKMRDRARHLICNYSYYFIDRMYMEMLAKRSVCVFDEAHLINDLFTEHNAIYFSDSRLKKMVEEVNETLSLVDPEVFKLLREVCGDLMQGEITDQNYMESLIKLADAYGQITESANAQAERAIHDHKKYLKLQKLSKKYFGLGCKIGDLIQYGYPHAFEFKERNPKYGQNENEISVKPIFVGDMFDKLINAEFNLLMSATLSETYARRTLTLENAKHIRLAPSFPREHKKVVFFKPQNLNYTSLKEPKVVKQLQATCYEIVAHHVSKGERGIILAPSFALTEGITQALEGANVGARIFEHRRGEKLAELIGRFTRFKDGPAVMLTPSGFEGLDLAGDLSRFQIILKAPFGSLGEARMKKILANWPDIYSLLCTMKLVQGAGRSVRGPDDWATTYMLDSNIQRLWTAKNMEWADEFETKFTSFLDMGD
jgi:ATP-dependent DNA helicase DinG